MRRLTRLSGALISLIAMTASVGCGSDTDVGTSASQPDSTVAASVLVARLGAPAAADTRTTWLVWTERASDSGPTERLAAARVTGDRVERFALGSASAYDGLGVALSPVPMIVSWEANSSGISMRVNEWGGSGWQQRFRRDLGMEVASVPTIVQVIGSTHLLWVESIAGTERIMSARRLAATWTQPEVLRTLPEGLRAVPLAAAADASGHLYATWVEQQIAAAGQQLPTGDIRLMRFDAAVARWEPSQVVARSQVSSLRAAVLGTGPLIVWADFQRNQLRSWHGPSGTGSERIAAQGTNGAIGLFELAALASGDWARIVWTQRTTSEHSVQTASFSTAAGWSSASSITAFTGSDDLLNLSVAVEQTGRAWLTLDRNTGTQMKALVATGNLADGWLSLRVLDDTHAQTGAARVAATASSGAAVSWIRSAGQGRGDVMLRQLR